MGFLDYITPSAGLRGKWLTFWFAVGCGADMALYGYDQGVFGGVVISPDYLRVHDLEGPSKTNILSTVTAIYNVGCFLGAVMATWVGGKLGRKKSVIVGIAIMTAGAILQTTSYSVPHMIVARIVSGIGNGINSSTVPVWQTETAPSQLRGKLVILQNALLLVGFSISNWINYGIAFADGPVSWRFPLAFQLVFIIMIYLVIPFLPESPRWLVIKGRDDEALKILSDIEDKPETDAFVLSQLQSIKYTAEYERSNGVSWSELFRGRTSNKSGTKTIRRLILGMGTQSMMQFSGINVTSYYMPTVLTNSVGLSPNLARLLAACNSIQYLLWSLLGIRQVDRWGRRNIMMFAATGQCFCYIIITALIRYNEMSGYPNAQQVASASVAFFFLYYVFFGMGMQGVPWLYPTEINSLTMRAKGAAIGAATNWILNFMVVEITPIGIQNLGWRFYIIWVSLNAAMVPILYLFYPETAGRTLEDIDEYYRSNPPLLVFRDKEATSLRRPERYRIKEEEVVRKNDLGISGEDSENKGGDADGVVQHEENVSR
ncbi:sugar porter family MFS transporter [Aspergillus stella-maris]|uniref:sugar porter family MFS transporter n=1 Tax=Aspergillus stella-maris TaxID=1810926 RepID=UPI003CCE41B2